MEFVQDKDVRVGFQLAPGDILIYCPYNKTHQILVQKAGKHLNACRLAYVNGQGKREKDPIKVCKWQQNHHVRASQLASHEKQCEDNRETLMDMFNSIPAVVSAAQTEPDEWD